MSFALITTATLTIYVYLRLRPYFSEPEGLYLVDHEVRKLLEHLKYIKVRDDLSLLDRMFSEVVVLKFAHVLYLNLKYRNMEPEHVAGSILENCKKNGDLISVLDARACQFKRSGENLAFNNEDSRAVICLETAISELSR